MIVDVALMHLKVHCSFHNMKTKYDCEGGVVLCSGCGTPQGQMQCSLCK